ncbi:uncharacterized protein H6S33_007182 [Morchella sextelata]|uniref:uncharacterized protein n=1 Tax=Morchella sextelata TaxID=1174677 RepID=UPI001D04F16A|nr:uncharacterized protein H6S33_007182 [Morchella sextelata]KAH0604151.1 hypothetical protein H6S33_007182 [Morchella sextelata]
MPAPHTRLSPLDYTGRQQAGSSRTSASYRCYRAAAIPPPRRRHAAYVPSQRFYQYFLLHHSTWYGLDVAGGSQLAWVEYGIGGTDPTQI